MGQRLGLAGFQNTGKSFTRRYIPDGENVIVIQPSRKASYLFTGPKGVENFTTEQIDEAIKTGKRRMLGTFDLVSPEGKFKNLQQAAAGLKDSGPHTDQFDALRTLLKYKKAGYFKPEHLKGNVIFAPQFEDLQTSLQFVDKLLPWVHTVILPDFTHFITERITSQNFLNQKFGNEAFSRYLEAAAESFRSFIRESDHLRENLIVVTEYHIEENKELGRFEIFVPGGKMVKEKFLPSSYYDFFLFTDVKHDEMDEEANPEYRYVTRTTKRYPEARSMGLFESLFVPNNLQDVLTKLRDQFNIQVKAA
jgi:hypothetical protein